MRIRKYMFLKEIKKQDTLAAPDLSTSHRSWSRAADCPARSAPKGGDLPPERWTIPAGRRGPVRATSSGAVASNARKPSRMPIEGSAGVVRHFSTWISPERSSYRTKSVNVPRRRSQADRSPAPRSSIPPQANLRLPARETKATNRRRPNRRDRIGEPAPRGRPGSLHAIVRAGSRSRFSSIRCRSCIYRVLSITGVESSCVPRRDAAPMTNELSPSEHCLCSA